MSNFSTLKTAIRNAIKQNGNQEITGNVLQNILISMVETMGDGSIIDLETLTNQINDNTKNGYVYAGIATPSTIPVTGKVFYIALQAGTYTNFGGLIVVKGITILKYNGSTWSQELVLGIDDVPTAGSDNLVKSGGVFASQAGVFGIPSSPQGFLRRVDPVGNTKFSVDKWLDYGITDYTLELCFRYKGSDSTKFLLSWQENGGSAYALRVLADNKMDIVFPSALHGTLYMSNYVNKDVRLTLKRTEQAVMVYVNGNLATVTSYTPASGSVSEVYLGSWITGQVGYVTDYYYLRLIDNITGDVVKQINVGSDFEELSMERHTLGRIFKNASSGSGSELTDGDVILTGEITLNSTVTLDANTHIRGNDCIVHVGANGKLIMGEGCSIDGVVFDGGLAYTRTKKEGANYYNLVPLISVSDIPNYATYIGDEVISILGENATITNCRFDNIDRLCIKYNDNNQAYLVKTQPNIINNYFFNCRAGILYQGEFGRIIGNVFNSVVYGSIHSHGNLTMSSCIYMRCDVGQLIVGGGNPGHSEFSALEFAHNGIAGLYVLSLPRTVGNVYSGCQWADAPIIGENCNALLITGSRLDCWVEIAAGNANAFIANNVYKNYATRDNKPIFGGQVTYNLKVNNAAGANVTDSEINN